MLYWVNYKRIELRRKLPRKNELVQIKYRQCELVLSNLINEASNNAMLRWFETITTATKTR